MKTPIASLVPVLGIYKIKYPSHWLDYDTTKIFVPGFVQVYPLISQTNYLEIVRPFLETGKKIKEIFFTTQSPLGNAIETGILYHYGGSTKVKITKIREEDKSK